MQQVDFEYEVIVLEDCSTDKTREIVLEYQNKFTNIRYFFNKRNHGGKFTHGMGYSQAQGKYCCLLEGDDYWTNSEKLQQQVDFLDRHPNFVGCSHNTELYYENENKRENMLQGEKISSENTIINLIDGSAYFHTSSYVWRTIFKNNLPKAHFYNSTLMGDWFLSMLFAQHGKIHYIDQVMSCYRITSKGVWSKLNEHQKYFNNIRGLYLYNKLLNYKYAQPFTRIWWACDEVMQIVKKEKGSKLLYLKLWFLKHSINVKANNYTRIWSENIKEFKDKCVAATRKKWHGFTQLHIVSYLSKIVTCRSKLLNFLFRGIQKIYSKCLRVIDIFIMKTCEFIFQAFFLWDANRYFLYYKLKIYQFFKIAIYK